MLKEQLDGLLGSLLSTFFPQTTGPAPTGWGEPMVCVCSQLHIQQSHADSVTWPRWERGHHGNQSVLQISFTVFSPRELFYQHTTGQIFLNQILVLILP